MENCDGKNRKAIQIYSEVIIRQCYIDTLYLDYCCFYQGLTFIDNVVINDVDYQAGVHNKLPFEMRNNVFRGFLDFFDCQFESSVYFTDNMLLKGTNLLGNKGEGWENSFDSRVIVERNFGVLDISE